MDREEEEAVYDLTGQDCNATATPRAAATTDAVGGKERVSQKALEEAQSCRY